MLAVLGREAGGDLETGGTSGTFARVSLASRANGRIGLARHFLEGKLPAQ
jgi:hypothetical protein